MSIRKIVFVGEPILRQKAQKVRHVDKSIEKLIDDMAQTMHDANGLGLAANQVGVLQRVVVIELPYDEEDLQSGKLYALINPEIVQASDELISIEEGCLSIPYYFGAVTRPDAVVVKARDRKWREVKIKATGMLARAIQHEIDHLNGVLYIDRMESMDKLRYVPATSEAEAETEAFKEASVQRGAASASPALATLSA
jgi:peptide deformylase